MEDHFGHSHLWILVCPWLACELLWPHSCVSFCFVSGAQHGPCAREAMWSSRWNYGLTSMRAGGVLRKPY